PSVDPPIITVRTDYPGANAEIIESQITEPLEIQINRIDGIKTLTSISATGRSTIRAEFSLDMDLDNAANDVRDRVSQAVRNLPPDCDPPIVSKADADAQTIVTITLQSDKRDLLALTDIAQNVFAERIQTISGVSQVNVWGSKQYAMRLNLDVERMNALKLNPIDVRNALAAQNIELPSGQIEGERRYLTIQTYGRLNTPEEFDNLVIADRNGTIIRLKDIGRAELGALNEKSIMRGNGGIPMVGVAVQPQPGSNYIDIVDNVYRRVESLKKEIPQDIIIGTGLDVTTSIRKSISDVQRTIIEAFLLVVAIIFLFLRNIRTTLIPIIAIPISLIGGFIFLWAAGFSINVLTLLAMLLATGIVVDDAIVMMENIYAKIEQGMSPVQAAFTGSRQVFFAIISTTITLVCVFLPIFFMFGLTGRLFREFAMVMTGSIIISMFISLTLTVTMCSRMLTHGTQEYRWLRQAHRPIDYVLARYPVWLGWFMTRRRLSIPLMFGAVATIVVFMLVLKTELAPLDDKSAVRLMSIAPEGTSYPMMDEYHRTLIALVDTMPEKENLIAVTAPGFGASGGVNTAFTRLMLTPPDQREKSQMEIVAELNRALRPFSMAQTYALQDPTISGAGGGRGGLPVQYVLQAADLAKLERYVPDFLEAARAHPAFEVVDIDLRFTRPELIIDIARDRAFDLGVSVRDIAEVIQTYFSEQRVGYFIRDGKQYFVIAHADPSQRRRPEHITDIQIRSSSGELISLGNVVTLRHESQPPQLLRYNRYASATVSAAPAPGYTLGDGIAAMDEIADRVLDETFLTSLAGTSADFAESSSNLLIVFLFALLLVYLTLAAQFESFRDPLTVMMTVPLALAGALLTMWIFGETLNIFSEIGIIMLIGIVTKNGILIVEFANQKRLEGLDIMAAATAAAIDRIRPILMTTLATVLGAVPLAISLDGTANSRVSMGVVIIGGLLFSLALTLFIIPALYTYITRKTPPVVLEEDA
ncbi:MAG: efflux RND transporter permease subunit, partial [Bacteroidota bacterium]|nr:efflux RND transporter permease subunit [Bacteroidota bacterium]